jgi:hypothetical protein
MARRGLGTQRLYFRASRIHRAAGCAWRPLSQVSLRLWQPGEIPSDGERRLHGRRVRTIDVAICKGVPIQMTERAPFDPGDPFDAMADQFRTQVASIALRAQYAAVFRDLGPTRQLECFIAGAMAGIVGVCFASIEREGRLAMIRYLKKCLAPAREMAEGIIDGEKDSR